MKLYTLGYFTIPSSSSYYVFNGAGDNTSEHTHDEMLHITGRQVVWSAGYGHGTIIRKSYRQALPARQVLFCTFAGLSDDTSGGNSSSQTTATSSDFSKESSVNNGKCLCVLQGLECVKVYAPDGAEFEVALPCKAARMWELPRGLLIERSVTDHDSEPILESPKTNKKFYSKGRFNHPPEQSNVDVAVDGGPMFFSLLHPLEELKPVSYTRHFNNQSKQRSNSEMEIDTDTTTIRIDHEEDDDEPTEFMCDPSEKILLCSPNLRLLVTYHEVKKKHSLWALLPASALAGIIDLHSHKMKSPRVPPASATSAAKSLNFNTPNFAAKLMHARFGNDDIGSLSALKNSFLNSSMNETFDDSSIIDESVDDIIESEVFMQCIWTEDQVTEQAADEVFVAHDVDGCPLICFASISSCVLQALRVSEEEDDFTVTMTANTPISNVSSSTPQPPTINVQPSFSLGMRSAQAVLATGASGLCVNDKNQKLHDLLILTMDYGLELRRGQHLLCKCTLPPLVSLPPLPDDMGEDVAHNVGSDDDLDTSFVTAQPSPVDIKLKVDTNNKSLNASNDSIMLLSPTSKNTMNSSINMISSPISEIPANVSGNLSIHIDNDNTTCNNKVPPRVIGLCDAVNDRVNLVLQSGHLLRVSVMKAPQSCILLPCLQALDDALPPNLALGLRIDSSIWYDALCQQAWRKESICETDEETQQRTILKELVWNLVGGEGCANTGTELDNEWAIFIIVLARICLLATNETYQPDYSTNKISDDTDYWSQMLNTGYHQEYNLKHVQSLKCLKIEKQRKPQFAEKKEWWHILAPNGNEMSDLLPSINTNPVQLCKHYPALVGALHLVYEESKLSTLTYPLLKSLASLISGLVSSYQPNDFNHYHHHYQRDLGTCEIVSLPKLQVNAPVALPLPPNIMEWLLQRVRSGKTHSVHRPSSPTSHKNSGLEPFPKLESRILTQQLCCFYDLLAGGSGDNAVSDVRSWSVDKSKISASVTSKQFDLSALAIEVDITHTRMVGSFAHWLRAHAYVARNRAERVVLGMVFCGFSTQDMETLPYGLAIPLREALHQCSKLPSSRWPADAFVLIGREDMAALVLAPVPPALLISSNNNNSSSPNQTEQIGTPKKSNQADEDETFPSVTAVTPIWRRHRSERTKSSGIADDIIWGGVAANRKAANIIPMLTPSATKRKSKSSNSNNANISTAAKLLHHYRQNPCDIPGGGLLSIADFASLAPSATFDSDNNSSDKNTSGEFLEAIYKPPEPNDTTGGINSSSEMPNKRSPNADPSGFNLLLRMSALRCGADRRMREVCRLIRSSAPVRLAVERKPETTDHELVLEQQAKLLLLSFRTMALPVGRGMVTFATIKPLLTETLLIPALTLCGRIPPNNATVKLDIASLPDSAKLISWPSFHNGAAAGLRLAEGQMITPLTRTWIVYNKPTAPNYTHAGFLLALGLHGHLAALTMADTYEYLAQGHDATTVAILLGLGAAKRGTMTPTISKMLCLHIPSLLPAAFSELEVPSDVQAAALVGVGLLYQNTAHRLMTEFLLAEIGRKPSNDKCTDREGYSLAAGLSLGLVTLGHGAIPGGLSGLSDLRLEDRLHRYMIGGLDPENTDAGATDPTKCSRVREGPYVNVGVTSAGATLALALIFLKSGNETVAARLSIPDTHFLLDYVRPDLLMLRILARSLVLWDTVEATEDWLMSQVPEVVQEAFEMIGENEVAPSFNRKKSTSSFVSASNLMNNNNPGQGESQEEKQMSDVDDFDLDSIEREIDMVGENERRASFTHIKPKKLRHRSSSRMSAGRSRRRKTGQPVDEQAVKQAHANIISGACMSIGYRYVGTAHKAARDLIMKYIRHFATMRNVTKDPRIAAQRPDTCTLEMCLGAAAISLAMVMAGTCDLESLRLLRSLRWKVEDGVTYGHHMCIGMSIGLLFLGGGRASLSDSNEAIAAMLCSFFPRFPINTSDNQYHLQALRHFYVLAVEQRCLDTYDIDTRAPCFVPLEITIRADAMKDPSMVKAFANNDKNMDAGSDSGLEKHANIHATTCQTVIQMVAPCLLPPLRWISSIRVNSPRYWPLTVELDGNLNISLRQTLFAYRVLCVKRKAGQLSYLEDPRGVGSLLARPRPRLTSENKKVISTGRNIGISDDFLRVFTEDPYVLAFAKHFCSATFTAPLPANAMTFDTDYIDRIRQSTKEDDIEFAEFCTASLYECLTHEKPRMISTMVELYHTVQSLLQTQHTLHLQNLKLITDFYSGPLLNSMTSLTTKLTNDFGNSIVPLIQPEFLQSLNTKIEATFTNVLHFNKSKPGNVMPLMHYLRTWDIPQQEVLKYSSEVDDTCDLSALFCCYLIHHDIPYTHVLSRLNEIKSATKNESLDLTSLNDNSLPFIALYLGDKVRTNALLEILQQVMQK